MSSEVSSQLRYERLPSAVASDDEVPTEEAPPCYDDVASQECSASTPSAQCGNATTCPVSNEEDTLLPPSYTAATTLPTYEDVEKLKDHERMTIEALHIDNDTLRIDGLTLGTDAVFLFMFFIAFLFNWIGLFIGYFVMLNIAGRNGALAGFGASMIKWLCYLKYSDCCKDYILNQYIFIWCLFIFLSFVMCLRGVTNWLTVRSFQYMSATEAGQHPRFMMFS